MLESMSEEAELQASPSGLADAEHISTIESPKLMLLAEEKKGEEAELQASPSGLADAEYISKIERLESDSLAEEKDGKEAELQASPSGLADAEYVSKIERLESDSLAKETDGEKYGAQRMDPSLEPSMPTEQDDGGNAQKESQRSLSSGLNSPFGVGMHFLK